MEQGCKKQQDIESQEVLFSDDLFSKFGKEYQDDIFAVQEIPKPSIKLFDGMYRQSVNFRGSSEGLMEEQRSSFNNLEVNMMNRSRNISFQQKNLSDKQKKIEEMRQKAKKNLFGESNIQEGIRKLNEQVNEEEMMSKSQILEDQKKHIYYIQGNFSSFYKFSGILGEGTVGLVKKAVRISDGAVFAVKQVRTRDEETIMNIKFEFSHHILLDHPNIVKVYELYIDDVKGKVYTVMELIEGKELMDLLGGLIEYNENIAKNIFRQILLAIKYLHDNLVCHRDLKPSNILSSLDASTIKITDFNVSKFSESYKEFNTLSEEQRNHIQMMTSTGTLAYNAPEIFTHQYNESIDMWSAGCILYTMLSGFEPFRANVKDLIEKIKNVDFMFPDLPFKNLSADSKDLIQQCLEKDPDLRITPEKALEHQWLNTESFTKIDLGFQILMNIEKEEENQKSNFLRVKSQEDPEKFRQKVYRQSMINSNVFEIKIKKKSVEIENLNNPLSLKRFHSLNYQYQ